MFQSRCGFLPRRDRRASHKRGLARCVSIPVWVSTASRLPAPELAWDIRLVFQSRCGFLPRRDGSLPSPSVLIDCFNPGVGFYRVATDDNFFTLTHTLTVSIPVWVSTASRRTRESGLSSLLDRFNPGVGFYRVATNVNDNGSTGIRRFQSRCGFLPRRDEIIRSEVHQPELFQSRCGFLPRRDVIMAGLSGLTW